MAYAKLSIDIETRLASFEKDLKRAASLADGAAGQISSAFGALAPQLASAFSTAAIVSFTKAAIDSADVLNDLSQKTGLGITTLASYQLAAEQSGATMETVAKGLKVLSTEMVKNGDAMKAAGIDAKDADGAMRQLADLFSRMPDGIEKSALASALFGSKLGTELIPMLNLGAEGLDESAAASARFGAAMQALAPAADALNDTLAEIGINTKAMAAEFATGLLPTLQAIANEMNRGSKETGSFKMAGEALSTVLQTVAVLGANVSYVFTQIGVDIAYMVEQGKALATLDFSRFASLGEQARASAAAAREEVDALSERLLNPPPLKLPDTKEPTADLEKYRKQWEALLKSMVKAPAAVRVPRAKVERAASFADYDAQLTQRIASAIEQTDLVKAEKLVRELEKLDQLAAAGLDPAIVKAVRDDLTGATKAAADELARLNQLLGDTPTEKLEAARSDMLLLTKALTDGVIAEEQYLEAVGARLDKMSEKSAEAVGELDEFAKAAAKNIEGALADFLYDPFEDGLRGMALKFSDMIRRMAAEALAAQIASKIFGAMGKGGDWGWAGSAFSAIAGSFGGGAASSGLGANFWSTYTVPTWHNGGMVEPGGHTALRAVPAGLFAGARRYHGGGLVGDEVPAILQKGEMVLTKEQQREAQRPAPQQNIRIVNAFDNSVIGDYLGSAAGERIIMNAVQRNAGAFRQAVAG